MIGSNTNGSSANKRKINKENPMLKISNLRIPEELAQTLASGITLLGSLIDRIYQK